MPHKVASIVSAALPCPEAALDLLSEDQAANPDAATVIDVHSIDFLKPSPVNYASITLEGNPFIGMSLCAEPDEVGVDTVAEINRQGMVIAGGKIPKKKLLADMPETTDSKGDGGAGEGGPEGGRPVLKRGGTRRERERAALEKARSEREMNKKQPKASPSAKIRSRLKDVATYVGQVVNGVPEGYGKITVTGAHPGAYVGQVTNFHAHGIGVYTTGATRYEGQWQHSKPHGIGIMYYSNGIGMHIGQWRAGLCHGYGLRISTKGKVLRSRWKKGIEVGFPEPKTEDMRPSSGALSYRSDNEDEDERFPFVPLSVLPRPRTMTTPQARPGLQGLQGLPVSPLLPRRRALLGQREGLATAPSKGSRGAALDGGMDAVGAAAAAAGKARSSSAKGKERGLMRRDATFYARLATTRTAHTAFPLQARDFSRYGSARTVEALETIKLGQLKKEADVKAGIVDVYKVRRESGVESDEDIDAALGRVPLPLNQWSRAATPSATASSAQAAADGAGAGAGAGAAVEGNELVQVQGGGSGDEQMGNQGALVDAGVGAGAGAGAGVTTGMGAAVSDSQSIVALLHGASAKLGRLPSLRETGAEHGNGDDDDDAMAVAVPVARGTGLTSTASAGASHAAADALALLDKMSASELQQKLNRMGDKERLAVNQQIVALRNARRIRETQENSVGIAEAKHLQAFLIQKGGTFGDFAPPRIPGRRMSFNSFINPAHNVPVLIERSHAPMRRMALPHLLKLRTVIRAACGMIPQLLDARQRAFMARVYYQRLTRLRKNGPESDEVKQRKVQNKFTLARSDDRKYLATRRINDAMHGTGIAKRERIDLLRRIQVRLPLAQALESDVAETKKWKKLAIQRREQANKLVREVERLKAQLEAAGVSKHAVAAALTPEHHEHGSRNKKKHHRRHHKVDKKQKQQKKHKKKQQE